MQHCVFHEWLALVFIDHFLFMEGMCSMKNTGILVVYKADGLARWNTLKSIWSFLSLIYV